MIGILAALARALASGNSEGGVRRLWFDISRFY